MRWIVSLVFIGSMLVSSPAIADETVINMPRPPAKRAETGSRAAQPKTNPERLALSRYLGARTGTSNNYFSWPAYGPYGAHYSSGYYSPYYNYSYGYPSFGFFGHSAFFHGRIIGGRPFFWSGFGSVTFHR